MPSGILDINNPKYPFIEEEPSDSETHLEPSDESFKTNIVDYDHPIFSSDGIIRTINYTRNFANTKEESLDGEVDDQVFIDVAKAAKQTGFPADLLLFVCDWEQDLTQRSSASDALGFAQQMLENVPQLRQLFGRDPLNAEVFASHVLGSAQEVFNRWQLSIDEPEEDASPAGINKSDIVFFKLRNNDEKIRVNREVYDFFYRRTSIGKVLFKQRLGQDKHG